MKTYLAAVLARAKLKLIALEKEAEAHYRAMLQKQQVVLKDQWKALRLEISHRLTLKWASLLVRLHSLL
jgi:hypothetical protein